MRASKNLLLVFLHVPATLWGKEKKKKKSWMPRYKRQSLNLTPEFCNTFSVTYFTGHLT